MAVPSEAASTNTCLLVGCTDGALFVVRAGTHAHLDKCAVSGGSCEDETQQAFVRAYYTPLMLVEPDGPLDEYAHSLHSLLLQFPFLSCFLWSPTLIFPSYPHIPLVLSFFCASFHY